MSCFTKLFNLLRFGKGEKEHRLSIIVIEDSKDE